jgi:hypothetical protein
LGTNDEQKGSDPSRRDLVGKQTASPDCAVPDICYNGPMNTYSVEKDENGGYSVVVSTPGQTGSYVAIVRPTWQQAKHWIENRILLDREATERMSGASIQTTESR